MCFRTMNVRVSIETIDRLSKLMVAWVLEYDGIHIANKIMIQC